MKASELHFWSYYFDFIAFPVMISTTALLVFIKTMPAFVLAMALIGSRSMVVIRVSIPSVGISPVYIFSFSPPPPYQPRRIHWRTFSNNQWHLYFGDLLESIS